MEKVNRFIVSKFIKFVTSNNIVVYVAFVLNSPKSAIVILHLILLASPPSSHTSIYAFNVEDEMYTVKNC